MKKSFLVLFIVSFFLSFGSVSYAGVDKLKKSPSTKKILEEPESGLIILRVGRGMQYFKLFFNSFDPETGEVINAKTVYRFRNARNIMGGNSLVYNYDPEAYSFLMEEGVYIFRSLMFTSGMDSGQMCYTRTYYFEVKAGVINYIGDFNIKPDSIALLVEEGEYAKENLEQVQDYLNLEYPDLDYSLEINKITEFSHLPPKCKSYYKRTYIYP